MLDNFDNLQASWVTQGGKVGQLSLAYGANDMGSVMIEENVVRAAGASYCMDEVEIVRNIEDAGFVAKRRNMHYEMLGDPIFREREVPRMLELATRAGARATRRVPDELRLYPARSRAGKAARLPRSLTHRPIDPLSRRLGPARSASLRSATAGSPIDRGRVVALVGRRRAVDDRASDAPVPRRGRSRQRGHHCPGSSTRTRTSSCRICATRCRRRPSSSPGSAV